MNEQFFNVLILTVFLYYGYYLAKTAETSISSRTESYETMRVLHFLLSLFSFSSLTRFNNFFEDFPAFFFLPLQIIPKGMGIYQEKRGSWVRFHLIGSNGIVKICFKLSNTLDQANV